MAARQRAMRWGDCDLDGDEVVSVLGLPPSTTRGPDDNGVKTVIDYYRNDKGEAIKKTTKLKVVTMEKKVYKVCQERRQWKRFGRAAQESPEDSVTVQVVEDIPFERIRQSKATSQEKKQVDVQSALQGPQLDKQAISGSIKDILYKKRMERELLRAKGLLKEAEKPPEEGDAMPGRPALASAGLKPGSYVPPSIRNRGSAGPGGPSGEGESMRDRRRDENSVRVSNLSEDVTEADLQELFRPFGPVSRVFLATDRTTGESRGFAFINYVHRDDAERAIRALNGYGYDNLILRVEFSAPRPDRG